MAYIYRYMTGKPGPSGYGSATTAEEVAAQGISLSSKVVIITGATSGIGFETARVLAGKQGAHVVVPARKIKDSELVCSKITQEFPDARVTPAEIDLSSLASVRKFVTDFKALRLPLHILINNAGVLSPTFVLSPDGLELDFATNHMGHFLLVQLLLEDMIKTSLDTGDEARIVIVSSEVHKTPPFRSKLVLDKLNDKESFSWTKAYGRSKLANILHAKELARRLKERNVNVTVNALHPGPSATNLTREHKLLQRLFSLFGPVLKTIPQGAATTVYAAVHPSMKGVTGKYLVDCNHGVCHPYADDMNKAAELWKFSEEFVRVD